MESNENKALDDLLKKMIQDAGLETPSENFTHTVLHNIQQIQPQNAATIYKPLISKYTWLFLGLLFSGIMIYILFWDSSGGSLWKSTLPKDYNPGQTVIPKISIPALPETLTYSIIGLALLIYFQIFVLKRYLDNRLNLR